MKNRKYNRLPGYDYSEQGIYFVTICTKNREELFGEIIGGKIILNDLGEITTKCWQSIPEHFPHISLDEFVIMPNHIHGILEIINYRPVGGKNFCPLQEKQELPWQTLWARSLSSAVRGFKIGATKWCNENNQPHCWQRNFYDRIIRNESELNRIREYIYKNPANWERDRNNLENILM